MKIAPSTFHWIDHYVMPDGTHHVVGTDAPPKDENGKAIGPSPRAAIPEDALPLRRAGLILEDTAEIDLHLVNEVGIDWHALAVANTGKIQQLLREVAELKAGH